MTKITKELVDNYLEANPELAQDKRNADFNAVFLPNDVSAFGISAFANCVAMHAIRIPSEVSAIESSCFINCKALSSIDLPSISAIEAGTFKNCQSLQKIELPEAILAIKENAFQNCEKITDIAIDGMISVRTEAFSDCIRLSAVDAQKILVLSTDALKNCVSLSNIIEFSNLSVLQQAAFTGCSNIRCLVFPKLSNYSSYDYYTDKYLFGDDDNDYNLQELNLSQLMSFHAKGLVKNCRWLSSINLDRLEYCYVGTDYGQNAAIYTCNNLSSITVPKLSTINSTLIGDCFRLTTVNLPELTSCGDSSYNYALIDYCPDLSVINIPKFKRPERLNKLISDCNNVISVNIDNDVLTTVNNGTIVVDSNNYNAIKFVCPATRALSGDWLTDLKPAENFINQLTGIYCPAITTISTDQFLGKNNLRVVELNGINAISSSTFVECENLISASFNSVLSIEEYGIDTCNNLAIINIPSIKQFGTSAIAACDNLLSIVMSALTEVPQINGDDQTEPWDLINPDYKVYVNADIRDTMANTGWWKNIADKIIAL